MMDPYLEILNQAEDESEMLGLVAATLMTWGQMKIPIPPERAEEMAQAILNRDRGAK